MEKVAICPGSFDPITIGHYDIINRALQTFDKVIVAIGHNSQKKYLFSLEERIEFINNLFDDEPKVECKSYQGLTVNFCKELNIKFIVRGLRSSADFEYEKSIALLNQAIGEVETVFFLSRPEYSHISSSLVREILANNGDANAFLPKKLRGKVLVQGS